MNHSWTSHDETFTGYFKIKDATCKKCGLYKHEISAPFYRDTIYFYDNKAWYGWRPCNNSLINKTVNQ